VPAVVFVTAPAEFTLQALEAQAIDSLHKPFRRERCADTLALACRRLAGRSAIAAAPARDAPPRPREPR